MALDYATEHLHAALVTLASSQGGPIERLQRAWIDNVQMLWMTMCLPDPLNARFKDLWERYTAASHDPHTTTLRDLNDTELAEAITGVVDLAIAASAADARGERPAQKT